MVPIGMQYTSDEERLIESGEELAYCHDTACPGSKTGFLFFEETELCPWCYGDQWSVREVSR